MVHYDLCLAWNWEHDADFVRLLEASCTSRGLSLLQVTPQNVAEILFWLTTQDVRINAFSDRASEVDHCFMPLVDWAEENALRTINPHENAVRAWDKAIMYPCLSAAGLPTPYAMVLPSFNEQPVLPTIDLAPLGDCFTIKPAHGSGGDGVVLGANSIDQVLSARLEYFNDRYLLQSHVHAACVEDRLAWFRVIYCLGEVYPFWWPPSTHIYSPVTQSEITAIGLQPLFDIVGQIAALSGLDLFSSEIAMTGDGQFTIVDYTNEPIDFRLQSQTPDGVPDQYVERIAHRLAVLVRGIQLSSAPFLD